MEWVNPTSFPQSFRGKIHSSHAKSTSLMTWGEGFTKKAIKSDTKRGCSQKSDVSH